MKKLKKRSAVYVAQKGSVRVSVYLRSQVKNGTEYINFAVADYTTGKRKLWTLSTFEDAKRKANEIAAAIASGQTVGQGWSVEQKVEIDQALAICKHVGVGILPALTIFQEAIGLLDGHNDHMLLACSAWKKNQGNALFVPIRVEKAAEEFLARQTRAGVRRKRTLTSLIGTFSNKFADVVMHEVTPAEIQDLIASKRWCAKTVNDFLAAVSQLFTDAHQRGGVPTAYNPTKSIRRLKTKAAAIGVFQPWEARQILARIDADLVPFMAIWLFSGARKEEAARLSWQQINRALETSFFDLPAEQTKTGTARVIPVENNLRLWLIAHRKDAGSVLPVRWRSADPVKAIQRLDDLSKHISRTTGVVWVSNGPRHSFGSYHFKLYRDPGQTVDAMGTSLQKFERHYRSRDKLITAKSAEEWFNITPDSIGTLLTLPQTSAA